MKISEAMLAHERACIMFGKVQGLGYAPNLHTWAEAEQALLQTRHLLLQCIADSLNVSTTSWDSVEHVEDYQPFLRMFKD